MWGRITAWRGLSCRPRVVSCVVLLIALLVAGGGRVGCDMTGADLLESWREHLTHSKRRSPHTVRAYSSAALRLIAARELATWDEAARIEAPDLRRHLATRRAEGLGNASAARELSALKAFIAFAREQAGDPDPSAPRLPLADAASSNRVRWCLARAAPGRFAKSSREWHRCAAGG